MGSVCAVGQSERPVVKAKRRTSLPVFDCEPTTPVKFIKQQQRDFFNDYHLETQAIGQGLYGIIKRCRHRRSGLRYAVKEIAKSGLPKELIRTKGMFDQIELLKQIDHPCVLRIHEYYEDKYNYYIIMDFYSGGDLIEKVITLGRLAEKDAVVISRQILSAIAYLHSKNIVHRDIKPENIVLEDDDKSLSVKIIDFDTAVHYTQPLTGKVGTLDYMAPEMFESEYNEKCDMWSFGVLLYVLLSGNSPFGAASNEIMISNIKSGKFDLESQAWDDISVFGKDLIKKLLMVDPAQRISGMEALQHPWIHSESISESDVISALLRVQNFCNISKVKEVIYSYLVSHIIPYEQLRTLKLVFQYLDYNADGKLSKSEVLYFLNTLMEPEKAAESVEVIFSNGDSDKNGYLEYSEFLRAAIQNEYLLSNENIEKAYKMIDTQGEGIVTYDELKKSIGRDLSEFMFYEMIYMIDKEDTGEITFEQFKRFLLS